MYFIFLNFFFMWVKIKFHFKLNQILGFFNFIKKNLITFLYGWKLSSIQLNHFLFYFFPGWKLSSISNWTKYWGFFFSKLGGWKLKLSSIQFDQILKFFLLFFFPFLGENLKVPLNWTKYWSFFFFFFSFLGENLKVPLNWTKYWSFLFLFFWVKIKFHSIEPNIDWHCMQWCVVW